MTQHTTMNRILRPMGLQRRRSRGAFLLPALGVLGTGLAIGAGIGLLFAPRAGKQLRHEVSRRVNRVLPQRLRSSGNSRPQTSRSSESSAQPSTSASQSMSPSP